MYVIDVVVVAAAASAAAVYTMAHKVMVILV